MDALISLLTFFGITPDKYPFLVLAVLIIGGFIYIRISIGGQLGALSRKVGKVRDNVFVIITHLSTSASARGRLDTNLIQVMSPMMITSQGHELLQNSGFKTVLAIPENRMEILTRLQEQRPQTKLDVENYALVASSTFLERDFMNPVKVYLYNNPSIREIYTTLAGLYIRDEYLKAHPEITE